MTMAEMLQEPCDGAVQSWALEVFLIFFNKKNILCIFSQVNLTGSWLFKLDWQKIDY